ncbi:MAG: hypothetical protein LBU42_09760 [Prevotellaceae bacterium]|jgi:hypothetical protein|nr:hypothetical protein [Prevotellaceae bacterium]
MKTILFFFAMLISVAANATVKITPLSTDYSTNKVTFKVEWTNIPSAPYNNRVWVWIDFCPVTGTTPANSFSTATVSNPTKTEGNGTVTNATARGFFIEYAATNAGTTVTATLSNAPNAPEKFNWCTYGSDYPPNAISYNNGSYTFKGTKPFIVNDTTVNDDKYAVTTITALTDATGCPGGVGRDEVHNDGNCLPHLTVVGSYCRDLTDDNAISACNIEWKKMGYEVVANYSPTNHKCPTGWRPAMYDDFKCAFDKGQWDESVHCAVAADVLSSGYNGKGCCDAVDARWILRCSPCSDCMYSGNCGRHYSG